MNSRWRHVFRRTWFTAGGVLAVLAIVLAVLMALGQLLVPLVAHYPHRVAQMISQQLQRPVHFASMKGYWQPSGPMLVLHQVQIGERNGKPVLTLPTAKVKLDFGALIWPSRHWINLRLSGLKLSLERDTDGQWRVAGFGVAGHNGQSQHLTLGDLPGNLWLDNLELDIIDARSGHDYKVHVGPLRVNNGGGELRFAGLIRRGTSDQALKVAGQVRNGGLSGRLYLAAKDADLGRLFGKASAAGYAVKSGQGDLALWLTWRDRRVTSVTADVDLEHLAVDSPAGTVKAPRLRGLVRFQRHGDKAQVLFAPGDSGAARVDINGIGSDLHVVARAHHLDTGSWLALTGLAPGLPHALGHWLTSAAPEVRLASAQLDWSHAQGIHSLTVHFDHLGFAAVGKRPGVNHLYGVLRGDAEAVSLQLPTQAVTVDFPHLFRQPLTFSKLGGNLAVWHDTNAWHIGMAGLAFKSKALAGQLRGSVKLPKGGAPFLNLYASVGRTPVLAAEHFLPVGIMPPNAVKWLDHGLTAGTLDGARVVMHGSVADWPFTNHHGRFEAHAELSDLALTYDPHWPGAKGIDLAVDFVGNGMLATVTAGDVNGIKIKHAVANIPDFSRSELVLNAQGNGSGSAMIGLVRQSPIGKPHADVLDHLTLGGQGDFNFSLVVPLSSRAPSPFTLGGTVQLHDADVDASTWQMHMDGLSGPLSFNLHGFQARGLTATYQGQPVTLDMAVGPQTGHADWPLTVDMRGRFSLAQLVAGRKELAPVASMGSGSALFDIGFHIDNSADNAVHATELLTVHSNLRGLALDLPAPLAKPAQALWPLSLQLGFPFAGGKMQVILGNRLFARARLPAKQQPWAVDVRLGGLAPEGAMPASGVRVRGRAANLDVSGWVRRALSAAGGTGGAMPSIDVDVTAEHTHIFGQAFSKLQIKLHPNTTQLNLAVDGPAIKGSVTVPVKDMDKRGIVARFDRLYWPKPTAGKSPAGVPAPAASLAVAPTPQQAAAVGVAPSSLPPLHVWIGDLRFGDAHLGQVRLETWPTAQGMHIDMLRAQSKSMNIAGSGDWNGTASDSHTHLSINFSAASLGRMLDAFGYEGMFTGGQTHAQLDATWPGAPSSFALANVEGTLGVKIGEGHIPEVKPGVGRLFALMSIVDLPRRLTLDFGDVFGKGLGFDSITGHFRFHDGNAYTKDFTLKGPAVDIHVTGRVGFRTHDYDQHILAIPHIGNSLPIVGAVVAGPIGVAAGLAVQGLIGKGLNKAASARYHLTGPWDKPKITLLGKHMPQPAPKPVIQPAAADSTAAPAPAGSVRPVAVPTSAAQKHGPQANGPASNGSH